MTTLWEGRATWQAEASSQAVDPALLTRLHRVVGEALTVAREQVRGDGRRELPDADERALAQKLLADELRRMAESAYADGTEPLDEATEQAVASAVLHRLHGLAGFQPMLDDPEVRDIHASGHDRVWLTMRDGTKVR